jgi:lysophospholipase L1-like esterase
MKRCSIICLLALLLIAAPGGSWAGEVEGTLFHDANQNSRSAYLQRFNAEDSALEQITVYLLDDQGQRQTFTNETGDYLFEDLPVGTYFVEPDIAADTTCSTKNRGVRAAAALREGAIHIVTIGDSIGDTGSTVLYPERLADHFAEIATATFDNQALGGTTTRDWMPGAPTGYFEDRLLPALPAADVLTINLGLNDIGLYMPDPSYSFIDIVMEIIEHPEYVADFVPNLERMISAARQVNPDCDIVYVIYPNFGNSTYMVDDLGAAFQPIASGGIGLMLSLVRAFIGTVENLVLGDAYGALGDTWLDPYLIDEVHPGDEGHQMYADVIFETLGGVVLEDPGQVAERGFGFFAPDLVTGDDDDDNDDDTIDDDDDDTIGDDDDDSDPVDDDDDATDEGSSVSDSSDDDDEGACCG